MRYLLLMLVSLPVLAGEPYPSATLPPPYARSFIQLDTNRDGVLSFSEAFPDPRVSNNFNALDKNADGVLSPGEYLAIFNNR